MREYDYTPRPDVEQHFHIKELIERQEKRADDREYHRNKKKGYEEREKDIKDAKLYIITDFWCDKCKEDFKSQSILEIEQDWYADHRLAFYRSKCDKGHWCIRLVTDKDKDRFWTSSRNIIRDRGVFYKDTIQPWETGFNMLYKKI